MATLSPCALLVLRARPSRSHCCRSLGSRQQPRVSPAPSTHAPPTRRRAPRPVPTHARSPRWHVARGAGGSPGVAQRGRQARSQEARQGTRGQGQAGPSSRSWGQPLRGPWDTCPVPRHWNPPLRGPSGLRGSSSAPRACRSASGREAAEGVACSCGCGDLVCRPRQGGRSRGTRRREGTALRSGHARGLGRGGVHAEAGGSVAALGPRTPRPALRPRDLVCCHPPVGHCHLLHREHD